MPDDDCAWLFLLIHSLRVASGLSVGRVRCMCHVPCRLVWTVVVLLLCSCVVCLFVVSPVGSRFSGVVVVYIPGGGVGFYELAAIFLYFLSSFLHPFLLFFIPLSLSFLFFIRFYA